MAIAPGNNRFPVTRMKSVRDNRLASGHYGCCTNPGTLINLCSVLFGIVFMAAFVDAGKGRLLLSECENVVDVESPQTWALVEERDLGACLC